MHFSIIENGVLVDLPLIYAWRVGGELVYVGKANGARRPLNDYPNDVRKLLAGEPYRKNKPNEFRRIHRVLANAVIRRLPIQLEYLCNTTATQISADKRALIRQHNPRCND